MKLVENYFEEEKAAQMWEDAKSVDFCEMLHRGSSVPRLISVQGRVEDDGWMPIYRHPADVLIELREWSAFVSEIAHRLSTDFNQDFNHVLIQYYRSGNDFISEHSDKTIDLVKDTVILNFSLGSSRQMILRTKQVNPGDKRQSQKLVLPHNSVFVLNQDDNRVWLHQIKRDVNLPTTDRYGGERISFTFRAISTFINPSKMMIYGTGATSKSKESPAKVDNSTSGELLHAFSAENKMVDFDWNLYYGRGFDCIDCAPAS